MYAGTCHDDANSESGVYNPYILGIFQLVLSKAGDDVLMNIIVLSNPVNWIELKYIYDMHDNNEVNYIV